MMPWDVVWRAAVSEEKFWNAKFEPLAMLLVAKVGTVSEAGYCLGIKEQLVSSSAL